MSWEEFYKNGNELFLYDKQKWKVSLFNEIEIVEYNNWVWTNKSRANRWGEFTKKNMYLEINHPILNITTE